ncbi:MAG: hypothetical protein RLZZ499_2616, partial [Cyanobacteriota bacterium]
MEVNQEGNRAKKAALLASQD